MAVVKRAKPDIFNKPRPRMAPEKSRVVNILNIARAAGSSFVSLMAGVLAAALILYSGYVLYDSFYTQNAAASNAWDLLQYKPEILDEGAAPLAGGDTLSAVTADYRAWLTMYETSIDYAVMQGPDDLYYASHDIYGRSSLTGAIYLASANSGGFADSYNLLYGHHMDNGAMFGSLDKFTKESYFDAHREGVIVTSSGVYDLTTFAVLRTNAYEAGVYYVSGKTAAQVIDFIESASPIIYRAGVANDSSKIVAFSTCASADTDGRLVVYAVMTPRDMSETQSGALTLRVSRYEGVYDGQEHGVTVNVNLTGATVEYSVDGGKTWTRKAPRVRDVNGSTTLLVRASYPGMESVSAYTEIRIIPRLVVVTAVDAGKTAGTDDPAFTATVEGLVGNDTIEYTVTRPGAGTDEAVGIYEDAIVASGDAVQHNGSYNVVYHPADFTIVEENKPVPVGGESIDEPEPPLGAFFKPTGSSYGDRCWALVNLICLLLTAGILAPVFHWKHKFGRPAALDKLAGEQPSFADKVRSFRRRFRLGVGGETVTTILALVAFLLTEDMRLPMVLIDKWTPLMLLLLVVCFAVDVLAVRLHDRELLSELEQKP